MIDQQQQQQQSVPTHTGPLAHTRYEHQNSQNYQNNQNHQNQEQQLQQTWTSISSQPNGVLTDNFITAYDQNVNWTALSLNYYFSLYLLRMYFHRVTWAPILKRQNFSEPVLSEFSSSFDKEAWDNVAVYQNLSRGFIQDHKNNLDFELLYTHQPHIFHTCHTINDTVPTHRCPNSPNKTNRLHVNDNVNLFNLLFVLYVLPTYSLL